MKSNLFPFHSEILVDPNAPQDSVSFVDFKYKTVQVGTGEPPRYKEVVDWEATAKASSILCNIGSIQGE